MLFLLTFIFFDSVSSSSTAVNKTVPRVLLVSFDGFKADYLNKFSFPNLQKFITDGVLVEHVTNIFITKTFPNHYTLVTGLYAESHGIIANSMYDAESKEHFRTNSSDSFWWNEATPIWVTNQLQGHKSATVMWPGSGISLRNTTVQHHMKYNMSVAFQKRVDILTDWLKNMDDLITFACLYWHEPDFSGHLYGPDNTSAMSAVLKDVDDNIGYLIKKLNVTGLWDSLNVIITSDHGMAQCSSDNVIKLDSCVTRDKYILVDTSPVAAVIPTTNETEVYSLLKNCSPHMKVYLKQDIPDRFHYKNNIRITPIILVADEGWTIVQNGTASRRGDHGYDNALPSMHPFLAGHGPAFRKGYKLNTINNLDVYPLMCHILGLKEEPNNGTLSNVNCLLASQWCINLPEAIGIVIGAFIILTTLACLIIITKNRMSPSRPFSRLQLDDDDDDDPLIV